MIIENLLYAIITSVTLSLLGYAKNHPDTHENFDYKELSITVIFGVIVGIIVSVTGFLPTNQNIEAAFVQYAGLITIIRHISKAIYRKLNAPISFRIE